MLLIFLTIKLVLFKKIEIKNILVKTLKEKHKKISK